MLCCSSSFLSFLLPVLSAGFAFCLASAVVYILSLRMEFGVLLAAFHVKTRLSNQCFLRTCGRGCFVLFLFPFLNALYALIVALPARGCGRACFLSCQLSWLVLLFRACLHRHLIGRLSPSPSIPLEMTLGSVDVSACKDGIQSFVRSSTRFCFLILERFSRRERRSELGEVPLTSQKKRQKKCAGFPRLAPVCPSPFITVRCLAVFGLCACCCTCRLKQKNYEVVTSLRFAGLKIILPGGGSGRGRPEHPPSPCFRVSSFSLSFCCTGRHSLLPSSRINSQ